MRKTLLLSVIVCLAATVVLAQAPKANVCEVHVNKVKPGMTQQYEQGRAKHMAWHKSQNDTWSWETYEVTTGENTGNYLIVSCGHDWRDFDAREKFNVADGQDAQASMGTALLGDTTSYYVLRTDIAPASPNQQPSPYLAVTYFRLKPEGLSDFTEGVKKIGAAVVKADPRVSEWYSLANGGTGPEMVLVSERKSIGDLALPGGKTVDQIAQEAYGPDGATTLTTLRKAYYNSRTELLHFRPDLSYMAPSTGR